MNYLKSKEGENYKGEPLKVYQFQEATLEAAHPPEKDASNKVATTGWVLSEINNSSLKPTIILDSDLKIRLSDGVVTKPNGDVCRISASLEPISVAASSSSTVLRREYVWIRYFDCGIVVAVVKPLENQGILLGYVDINQTEIVHIHNIDDENLASLESPIFIGDPQVPTPPLDDNDQSIANTEWVNSRLNLKTGVINDEIDQIQTKLESIEEKIDLETSLLKLPYVLANNGLSIKVLAGNLPIGTFPSGITCTNCIDGICAIDTQNISIPARSNNIDNPTKQIWVRYSDCKVISTFEIPTFKEGFRLAEVYSDDVKVTHVRQVSEHGLGVMTQHLIMGYGGYPILKDPSE